MSLTVGIVLTSSFPAFAQEKIPSYKGHKANVISGTTEVSKMEMSEVLTFDEIIAEIALSKNISKEQAAAQVVANFKTDYSTMSISPYAATYRTLTSYFSVTTEYQPSLKFYCQTEEWSGSFRAIVSILNVGMNRSSNNMVKQFSGTVYTHLETANRIFWIVNGDFYNLGSTTVNGGVNIKVGQSAEVNFGVSYATSYYAYCYKEGYYYF
ncbi:hypothetical protein [Fonticella tunisiensis]|uniref:hypothetical protein n=1 Tax=Fonticella tunisiensis TaxID=1096341 RepID=UPI001A9ABD5C|nr:hypothetical protein [Fonticella tunisiensis]